MYYLARNIREVKLVTIHFKCIYYAWCVFNAYI